MPHDVALMSDDALEDAVSKAYRTLMYLECCEGPRDPDTLKYRLIWLGLSAEQDRRKARVAAA